MFGPLIPTYNAPWDGGLVSCDRPTGVGHVLDAAQAESGHLLVVLPCPCRAASRQSIKASPAKGLARKQVAPALRARTRVLSMEKAVMKMKGTRYPLASRWACSSKPFIAGI